MDKTGKKKTRPRPKLEVNNRDKNKMTLKHIGLRHRRDINNRGPTSTSIIPEIELKRLSRAMWKKWREHMHIYTEEKETYVHQKKAPDSRVWRRTNLTARERFKKAIRQVRMIVAVNLNLNKYADEAGHSMFAAHIPELLASTSTPNVVVSSPDSKETISFNKKDFKCNYEFKWPKKAEYLVEKQPADRTQDDISVIRGLMRGLHSFRKYTRESQNLICKVVRLERYCRRRVVVRKGHIGYAFYFVFSGAAGVTLDQDESSAFVKKEVSVLKKGACFGEIALLKDVRRKATVVCMEETELLAVDRDDFFNNGLHIHFENEFKYRYDFFRKLELFSSWSEEQLQEVSDMGRIEEYNHDSVLVKDLRDINWLLFVTKGRCDVLKLVDIAHCITTPLDNQPKRKPPPRSLKPLSFGGDVPLSIFQKSEEIPDPEGRRGPSPYSSTSPWVTHRSISNSRPKTTGQLALKIAKESELRQGKGRSQSATVRFESTSKDDENTLCDDGLSFSPIPKTNHQSSWQSSFTGLSTSKEHGVQTFKTSEVDAGVYIKVDALRPGQCFGMEGVSGEMPHLSLVSCGCEIIRVSMSKFREYADEETLEKVEKMIQIYPTDNNLWSRYLKQSKWNNYKNSMIENIFREKRTGCQTYISRPGDNSKLQFVRNAFPKISFSAQQWVNNVVPCADGKEKNMTVCHGQTRKPRLCSLSHQTISSVSVIEKQLSASSIASSTSRASKNYKTA